MSNQKPVQGKPNYLGKVSPKGFATPGREQRQAQTEFIANMISNRKFYVPRHSEDIVLPEEKLSFGGPKKKK